MRRFFFLLIKQISQLLSCQTPAWHHQLISNRFLYFPISGTTPCLVHRVPCCVVFPIYPRKQAQRIDLSVHQNRKSQTGIFRLIRFCRIFRILDLPRRPDHFPLRVFVFFGFFGFFYEGKMSNTLIDERYKENKMRAQSTANKTALSIIFLQY